MKTTRKLNLLAGALVGALTLSTSLLAQEVVEKPVPKDDPWRFLIGIPGWGAAVSGDITVRGRKADVDVGLDELLDHLKGIAMLGFEARKEKFGFYAQPNWIKLEADANVGPLDGNFEEKLWIVDAAGFYQLHKWCEEKPVTLDALVGVRYWNVNNELTVEGRGGLVNFHGSDSANLYDPIVGLRAKMYLTQKLSLSLHGDVGGFSVSQHSSDLSWQALGTFGYDLSRHFSLALGYRALSVDKDSGNGSNAKGMDIILHGFVLGIAFHW